MQQSTFSLYSVNDIRALEKRALDELDLTEDILMQRAAESALDVVKRFYPNAQKIAIYCGGGNNGGDGYLTAYLLAKEGLEVCLYIKDTIEKLPDAARHAATLALSLSIPCFNLDDPLEEDVDLIIDALLGIGYSGSLTALMISVIESINESMLPVLALDVPSGLYADTGRVIETAIKASQTITFIGYKRGMFTLDGPDYCGELILNTLQLTTILSNYDSYTACLEDAVMRPSALAPRRKNSHKGDYGHILIIGGGLGMPGAPWLAAKASYKVGAGLVTVATRPEYEGQGLTFLPEALSYGIDCEKSLDGLIAKADICILGPGLGEDEWAYRLFKKAIASQLPMIIDASALRLLADFPQYDDNWVLTPHPAEAASLLQIPVADISANRFQAVEDLQAKFGGVIVLKGNGSLIKDASQRTWVCKEGNPGMACAGMGDVLSGIIAGLYAQGLTLSQAAQWGVMIHARAADELAQYSGTRGLLAHELYPAIQRIVNNR